MKKGRLILDICVIDLDRQIVLRGGHAIDLTLQEWRLLCYLAEHLDEVVSREELLAEVGALQASVVSRAADSAGQGLRLKLEPPPSEPRHLPPASR